MRAVYLARSAVALQQITEGPWLGVEGVLDCWCRTSVLLCSFSASIFQDQYFLE